MAYVVGFIALLFAFMFADLAFDGLGIDFLGMGDHIPSCDVLKEQLGPYATCGNAMGGFGQDDWGLSAGR